MEKRNPDVARAPKVSFVSLGCPKALVDSERIITRLRAEGYELTRAHEGADVAVVNTCGFLEHPEGEVVFRHACKLGAEGIVCKRLGSRYRSGRSPD